MPRRVTVLLSAFAVLLTGTVVLAGPAAAAPRTGYELLGELVVVPENPVGYNRDFFGSGWGDPDGNGCDTRADVLDRTSMVPAQRSGPCTVLTGKWRSWLDGAVWTEASDVDIDHLVPVAEAWRSGARDWTYDRRVRFYNDDRVLKFALLPVTDNTNAAKGDKDIADWQPPLESARCDYALGWVAIKYRWSMSMNEREAGAVRGALDIGSCGTRSPENAGIRPDDDDFEAPGQPGPPPSGQPVAQARPVDPACPPGQVPEDGFADVPASSPHEDNVD